MPDFLYGKKFRKLDHDFMYFLANFLLRMRKYVQNSTSGLILTQNSKSQWAVPYSNTNFGGASEIYMCFERKTAFVMQNQSYQVW